jgi:hypothetical protein
MNTLALFNTAFISGGAGGSVNNLNGLYTNPYYVDNVYGVTQSWSRSIVLSFME